MAIVMTLEGDVMGPCGTCGLPMSKNPHPDAGKPNAEGVAVGYAYECIPCLVATRNRVGAAWREEQRANTMLLVLRSAAESMVRNWAGGIGREQMLADPDHTDQERAFLLALEAAGGDPWASANIGATWNGRDGEQGA